MKLLPLLKSAGTVVRKTIIPIYVSLGLVGCGLGSDNTNIQPIASAGNKIERFLSDADLNGNIVIQLKGTGQDNGGRITQYLWEIIAFQADDNNISLQQQVIFANPEQAETTFTVPAIDASYTLRLTVTDDAGASDSDIVRILIGSYAGNNPNVRTGIVSAGANQTVTSGDQVTLEATAENFSGDLSYEWRRISQSGLGTNLTNYKARIASFTAPDVFVTQDFVIQVRVSAQNEERTSQTTITVDPKPSSPGENVAPNANAGADQLALPGATVNLNGLGSDLDGIIASYNWTQTSDNTVIVDMTGSDTANMSFIAPNVDTLTFLRFSLQVYDDDGAVAADEVFVNINPNPPPPINRAPFARASANKTVMENVTVTLTDSGSTDADGTIDSYTWLQIGGPPIVLQTPNSASSSFTSPVFGQDTELSFQLTVTDNLGATGVDTTVVTVTANTQNVPPTADAGAGFSVSEGRIVTITGTGADPDGTIKSYLWSVIPNSFNLTLQSTNTDTVKFVAPRVTQSTQISLQFRVTDNRDASTTSVIIVTIDPIPNIVPVANAGPDQSIDSAKTVTLNGSGTDSNPGFIASYQWNVISGPAITLLSSSSASTSFLAPTVNQTSEIILELVVTDNNNAKASDTVIITVNPINAPPVANAGPDQAVASGAIVNLSGSGSDSGGAVTYQWSQTQGPTVTLVNSLAAKTRFTAPNLTQNSDIILRLTVTDNLGVAISDIVIITVLAANIPPVANAGANQTVTSGNPVLIDGSGSTDSDGNIVSYLWSQISGPALTLDSTNNNAPSLSFPAPAVTATNTIRLKLTVIDNSGDSASAFVDIIVNPANQPPIANAGPDFTAFSGDPVIITGAATDKDGTVVGYRWIYVSGPTVVLNNASTNEVSFTAAPVTQPSALVLELTVTDDQNATASDRVTINISPANKPPTANAGGDLVANSGAPVTVTGSGSDSDGQISSYLWTQTAGPSVTLSNTTTTVISFTAPSITLPTTIILQLKVTDNNNATAIDLVSIVVNVPPIANAGIDMSAASGSPVSITGSGSDIDGTISNYQWTQTTGPSVVLTAANTAIVSFTAPTVSIDTAITLQLTVTDNQQLSSASDPVTITITAPPPTTNIAPVANIAIPNRTAVSGDTVSITGSGSDSDGRIVSYNWIEFGGTTLALATANTATVSFVAPTVSAVTTFTLQLTVTDNQQAVGHALVSISVSPPAPNNILPVANAGLDKTVNEGITVVITGLASDADGSVSTTIWTQSSGPAVTLVNANTRNISLVAPPVLVQSIVVLAFTVTDNSGGTSTDVVNITVNPVNNPPVANAGADIIAQEQTPITLSGSGSSDADGTISSYLWKQIQGPVITLNTANQVQATFTAPAVTQTTILGFRLTVTDNSSASVIDTMLVTINPNNILPTANAGIDQTVTQAATVLLTGGGTDSDGTLTGFLWTQIMGTPTTPPTPTVNLILANTKDASFVAPAVTQQTSITLQLTVTDNSGGTATDLMIVTINPGNIPPIANAGLDINTNSATRVTLSGIASTDPDGTIAAYQWSQIGNLPLVTLSTPNAMTTQFTTPVVVGTPESLFFRLTVTDNLGATSIASSVIVTVYPPSSLSGRISSSPSNMVDLDVNDTSTTPVSNDGIISAQHIGNPGVLGGYVNLPRRGAAGNSFTAGDPVDVFHVTLNANQAITVYVGNPITGVNEIGLELLDTSGLVITASMSGTAIESIIAVAAGDYFIRVSAQAGASNYLLTMGTAPLQVQSNGWTLADDFIPGEVIVEFNNAGPVQQNTLSFKASEVGLTAKAGAAGRSMLMGIDKSNKSKAFSRLAVTTLNRISQDSSLQNKLDTLIAAA
ncbi:MAG: PKD domain-containing protein, partial [Thiohalomonadales bacterium]